MKVTKEDELLSKMEEKMNACKHDGRRVRKSGLVGERISHDARIAPSFMRDFCCVIASECL